MGEVKRVGVRELRDNLSVWLREAEAGAEVVVVSRGREVARLVAPKARASVRFGALKGQIGMASDFDEWPEGMSEAMEGADDGDSPKP